ncbi:FAD-binding oxidoreductase [Actomonas aquatica]|uniref:FAD-linked oxidase C-terminal domain-containing protein n=1 Tax=Actomonas aquatica TaxID=2866162 RepID=A0ABZ1C8K0_9BACT|nr:FAD-linked oxidase C-terminal domain-containing protein [Opitutus sp. WL0086]WRQ87593.1 FAD-linked oxidase C-terminal domain-containing protein [Opitutus sp. WL0086]
MPSPALQTLQSQLPADRVAVDAATRAAYDADAQTAYRQRAIAVVTPHTTDELIRTVRWCHAEGVPFTVRGSGTGLSAGATPVEGGIAIVTTRLNRILRLDPVQRIAVVEPGVVNLNLTAAAAPHGLFYAPDPSSQPVCTLGGNVGFNAGGAHCLKHGMTSNHVLGLKAVLATGEVVTWGGDRGGTFGPDWTGLFVGNEGLFGVALEITLNLQPVTDGVFTVLAGFPSAEAAGDAVSAIIAAGIIPVAIELLDALTIQAVRPVAPLDYPPDCDALLVIELEGPGAIVAAERPRLEAVLRSTQTTGLVIARNAAERAAIWKVRKSSYSAYGRLAPSNMVQDCVVPRRHLGTALRRIGELSAAAQIPVANICHAGDGNIHPNLLHDATEPGIHERVEHLAGEILTMCLELGGSITGEHGVGLEKRPYLARMYGPAEIDFFHRLRHAYDPSGIANPGKLLPDRGESGPAERRPDPQKTTDLETVGWAFRPTSLAELAAIVRTTPRLRPVGAGTKPALNADYDGERVSLSGLSGITAYEPAEFVLTALAGTPLAEIQATLAAAGQCLAFDPPFAELGATLGGTVAANLNGPGSFGRGRVRDAVLGVTFVDGTGQILTVGSRVVKNVAGFDVPKFLVGSNGRYGVLAEITLKVVPLPEASITHVVPFADAAELQALLPRLANSPTLPEAIDVDLAAREVLVRHSGPRAALDELVAPLRHAIGELRALPESDAATCWALPRASHLGRVVIPTASLTAALADETFARHGRLSSAGAFAWLSTDDDPAPLHEACLKLGLEPQWLQAATSILRTNAAPATQIAAAVTQVFDPVGRFD